MVPPTTKIYTNIVKALGVLPKIPRPNTPSVVISISDKVSIEPICDTFVNSLMDVERFKVI